MNIGYRHPSATDRNTLIVITLLSAFEKQKVGHVLPAMHRVRSVK